MKNFKIIFLTLTILFLFLLTTITQAGNIKLRVIKDANVRLKPFTESTVIATVPVGAVLEAIGKSGSWYHVNLPPDEKGFVISGYIWEELVEVIEEKPGVKKEPVEVAPPPAPPTPPQPQIVQPAQRGIGFGVKLSGGMNYLVIGDSNEFMEGDTDWFEDLAMAYGGTTDGEFKKIHLGLDFEGDMIVYLNPRFGISVGSGYIYGKKGKDVSMITITWPAETETDTHDTKVSAIPVKIGVYYSLPMSSNARFFLNAGAGYYFARWSDSFRFEWNGDWYTSDSEAKGNGIGFHGGVGFEIDIARNFAFVIEGYGRYAKIDGFEGSRKRRSSGGLNESEKGTLYYCEWQDFGDWYSWIGVRDEEPPSGADIRNVREAKVDFSGFTIKAGIKIKF
ncbi:MAG: SH3 domain-containing protein [Candidatus Aminicenantia bacterium]